MNRRGFSIFNFSFLDWMLGFLGCVIIQLLLAQKSVERRPCPRMNTAIHVVVDSIKGITWGYNLQDVFRQYTSGDTLLAIIVGYKSLPNDTIKLPAGQQPVVDQLTNGEQSDRTISKSLPCQNCPQFPGLVNIAIRYENPDDRFYLYLKTGKTVVGFDATTRYDPKTGWGWGPEKTNIQGKQVTIGERIGQQEKIIPGVYEVYAQYWGNKRLRNQTKGHAVLYCRSKNDPYSDAFFELNLPKAAKAKDRILVAKVQVDTKGTLHYLPF